MLVCRGGLEQTPSSPDWVETKISGNVGPPNKQRTCAAIAEGACVSDLHAVWEVPHPPYVWNISALRGLNLTPALSFPSRAASISAVLSLGGRWQEELGAGGSTVMLTVCAGVVTLSGHVTTKMQEKRNHSSQERLSNYPCSALSSPGR